MASKLNGPQWRTANLDRESTKDLSGLHSFLQLCGVIPGDGNVTPGRKVDLIADILAARERYGKESARAAFKGITAAECNDWLRSLPPVPLYGEDGP